MKRVVIIQKSLVEYRKDFFENLKKALAKEDISLSVIYGEYKDVGSYGNGTNKTEWATYIPNKTIKLGRRKLIWQPCMKELKNQDLVIVEQANKLLINYILMFSKKRLGFKLGFWGHGRNRNRQEESLANRFKYLFLKKCDWWFAYTSGVKTFLVKRGYPDNQITVVENAIDTSWLTCKYQEIGLEEIEKIKIELGIDSERVGLFCGEMYTEKQIPFILETCFKLKEKVEDFHMIFLGGGKDAEKVRAAAAKNSWIHYVGQQYGIEKVKYFKIAALQLMPGAVGLGILDSFALETPLITTFHDSHGPEIDYLDNGSNGAITHHSVEAYSTMIIELLLSKDLVKMKKKCLQSASEYTLENMVRNFQVGIVMATGCNATSYKEQ